MLGPILSWRHCPPPRKTINVASVLLDTCIHRRVQLLVVHRYLCVPRGLSVNFATVGFIYNYPCPLKCNFCCHTKENVGEGRLHPGNVVPLILDFARYENVRRFAFTGGDPFVYIREILEIMRAARAAGVAQPFHMVTSGYWAKTDAKTQA